MNTKHGLIALALVAAAAGTGWALQVPTTEVTAAHSKAPSLSVLAWPRPAEGPDDEAAARGPADAAVEIEGLEKMSATGAASPQP